MLLSRNGYDIIHIRGRNNYDFGILKKGEMKMGNTATEFEKGIIPKVIALLEELPLERKYFYAGYVQCEVDQIHKEKADER